MKKFLIATVAVAMSAMAAPAFAQSIEGSIGIATIDTYGVNLNAAHGILGWQSGSIFGAEAEAQVGFSKETITPGVEADLNFEFGGYATASANLGDNFALFARAGYAWVDAETSTGVDLGDDGFAWGLGGKFFFDGLNGVRLDYTKFDFDNDQDVYSIAYVRRF